MRLSREDKVQMIGEVADLASRSCSVVLADYHGVPVEKMTELRKKAREQDVVLRVMRNTLLKLSLQGSDFEGLEKECVGPSISAFSLTDPGAAGRLLKDFANENEKFILKSFAVGGQVYPATNIDRLASLPNREQAITKVAVLMKMPITKFAQTINEVPTKLVRVLSAVKEQKA